jgi:hypothetical protein
MEFARRATAPLIPAEPTLAKRRLDPPEVDRTRLALEHDAYGVVEAARDPVGAAEVLAGAARQYRDLGLRTRNPVDDLVHRAVAADHDQERARRALRLLREMAPEFREHLVAAQAELGGPLPELRPAPPGRAVAGGRVDEKKDLPRGANRR